MGWIPDNVESLLGNPRTPPAQARSRDRGRAFHLDKEINLTDQKFWLNAEEQHAVADGSTSLGKDAPILGSPLRSPLRPDGAACGSALKGARLRLNADSFSSSFTNESAKSRMPGQDVRHRTAEAFQQEIVQGRSLELFMKVSLNLKSESNIAFTIKHLQITAFMQDSSQFGKLIPIATLTPDNEPAEGFTLGPLSPVRGPFIFSNDTIFANLVQELMLNPKGLVFKISNYDIVDERGRNFAFSSQEVNDRTAPLVFDFGFGDISIPGVGGTTERYRVSTSGGRIAADTNGDGLVDSNDRTVAFDPNTGRAVGITISDAMQNILQLRKYDEDTTPSSTLTTLQLEDSYSTKIVLTDVDRNPATPDVPVERLWRIRDVSADLTNPLKKWIIYTSDGIDAKTNFSDLILKPQDGLTFRFLQDLDNDGIDAAEEFILGSSDSNEMITVSTPDNPTPSANEGLRFRSRWSPRLLEYFGGAHACQPQYGLERERWGKDSFRAFSSPARADSDLDGVSDYDEFSRDDCRCPQVD